MQPGSRARGCALAPLGSLTINDGAPSVGKAAITEAARSFMVAFPDMQVLMDDLRLDGGRAEYHWTLVGTNTGPGGTGHKVRISGFEDWKIGADGLIAASLEHSIKPTTTANSSRASARNAGFEDADATWARPVRHCYRRPAQCSERRLDSNSGWSSCFVLP